MTVGIGRPNGPPACRLGTASLLLAGLFALGPAGCLRPAREGAGSNSAEGTPGASAEAGVTGGIEDRGSRDVSGRVLDRDGNPVAGADVSLCYVRGKDGLQDRVTGRTEADAQGVYRFEDAVRWEPVVERKTHRPPRYAVVAKHPEHGVHSTVLPEGVPTEEVDVVLLGLGRGNEEGPGPRDAAADVPPTDVRGRVLDRDGNPVAGADVWLYYVHGEEGLRDRLVGRTETDARGAYRFEDAVRWEPVVSRKTRSPPRHAVIAKHALHGISFTVLLEGDPTGDVDVELPGLGRRSSQRIEVVDEAGQPVAGATVFLSNLSLSFADRREVGSERGELRVSRDLGISSAVTGEDGVVGLIGGPAPGYQQPSDSFAVMKPGYVRDYARSGRCVLFPSARVSGKVTYPDGRAATGAAVWFGYQVHTWTWSAATVTGKDGRFEFTDVPGAGFHYGWVHQELERGSAGRATLTAEELSRDALHVGGTVSFAIKPGDDLTRDLTLSRGCVVAGQVLDLVTDEPVPNMCFEKWLVHASGGRYRDSPYFKADSKGWFRTVVAPGSHVLLQWRRSRDGDYIIDREWRLQNNNEPFRGVIDSDRTDLVFKVKLWPVQPLRGMVVDGSGTPFPGVSIYVHKYVPGVTTDERGCFLLKTAPTDRDFSLLAMERDRKFAALVELAGGTRQAKITLGPTRDWPGQVLNTEGLPAADLAFRMDLQLNGATVYAGRVGAQSDSEGRFVARAVCPTGTYRVWWDSGHEENRDYDRNYGKTCKTEVDLAALGAGELIRFEAKQYLNALVGHVRSSGGQPLEGARVTAVSRELVRQDEWNKSVATDKEGCFVLERLAPGDVRFRVEAKDHKTRSFTAPTDSVDFVAVLAPATGELAQSVTVTGEGGEPIEGAPLALWLPAHGEGGPTTSKLTATTDGQGRARFVYSYPQEGLSRHGVLGCDLAGHDLYYRGIPLDEETETVVQLTKGDACWRVGVTDQFGNAVPGAEVRVTGVRPDSAGRENDRAHASLPEECIHTFTAAADGRFELTRFSRDDWLVGRVSADGFAQEDLDCNPPRDQGEKAFTLVPGGGVEGRVVVKGADSPPSGSYVRLEPVLGDGGREVSARGSDGSFAVPNLKPGPYTVRCGVAVDEERPPAQFEPPIVQRRPGGAVEVIERNPVQFVPPVVHVRPGATAEVILELEFGVPVRGRIVEKGTGTRPKGSVSVWASEGGGYVAGSEVADDGSWALLLPAGEYGLSYVLEGMTRAKQYESAITVRKGSPIEGITIEAEPEPLPGEGIDLRASP